MPRLWELTTPQGKEILKKKARELGMLHFNPDDGYKEPYVKVSGKLEDVEKVDRLMREKPGFEKE